MKKILGIAVLTLLLSACATTLKTIELDDKTGRYTTKSLIPSNGVLVNTPFKNTYRPVVYVKTHDKHKVYNKFVFNSFKNMGVFGKVLSKKDLEKYVFENKLTSKVPSVSDSIGLHNLTKHMGNFLIVHFEIQFKGGYNFEADIIARDPVSNKIVFHVRNSAFNWSGLDQPLFYPLFNAFIEWSQGKQISTGKKKLGQPNAAVDYKDAEG